MTLPEMYRVYRDWYRRTKMASGMPNGYQWIHGADDDFGFARGILCHPWSPDDPHNPIYREN